MCAGWTTRETACASYLASVEATALWLQVYGCSQAAAGSKNVTQLVWQPDAGTAGRTCGRYTLLQAAQHPQNCDLLQACRNVDARQVAVQALERATELGIYAGVARYNMVLKWLCNQRALTEARQ